jgi:hypothetical protein
MRYILILFRSFVSVLPTVSSTQDKSYKHVCSLLLLFRINPIVVFVYSKQKIEARELRAITSHVYRMVELVFVRCGAPRKPPDG